MIKIVAVCKTALADASMVRELALAHNQQSWDETFGVYESLGKEKMRLDILLSDIFVCAAEGKKKGKRGIPIPASLSFSDPGWVDVVVKASLRSLAAKCHGS